MKKLYPLLSVLFLIYWGCLDPLNIFDSNDEETVEDETVEDETVNLWGVDYSIENTTVLDLSNSGLTGSIPPEIGNLTNLTYLDLNDNQLTGEVPESICDLNIDFYFGLDISNNSLCPPYPSCIDGPPFIGTTLMVGEQDISNCWDCEQDGVVELWGNCYSIEYTTEINLSNKGLTGSIPSEIGNLTNLISLKLYDNQLTGSIPPEIGNLTNLTELVLFNNQLTGSIPPEIGNLTNLTELVLSDNQLSGIIPEEICNQGDSSPSLSNNQLCPQYPSCIENYVGEQDISNCWDCEQDGVVELWGNCYSIEYTTEINLSNKGLTGSIPPEIGNLTNLVKLNLSYNQLTGSILPEIGNLTNLEELYLNNNQLTGSIPPEIGNLTNLTELVLFNNELTGSIPPEIGNLTNLTELVLFNNQLTGSIPPEIGNLTNLTELVLSDNQLSGIIPEEICNQGDSSPSLSNNQLCPPYPSCIEDYVGNQDTSDCD